MEELRRVFGSVCDDTTLRKIINEGDLDGDGQVSSPHNGTA